MRKGHSWRKCLRLYSNYNQSQLSSQRGEGRTLGSEALFELSQVGILGFLHFVHAVLQFVAVDVRTRCAARAVLFKIVQSGPF